MDGVCPPGWEVLNDDPDLCRKGFEIPKNWYDANAYCIGLGGQMATYKSDTSQYLVSYISVKN